MATEKNHSSTAWKLVQLIDAVASEADGAGVRELARGTGIDKSAISRLYGQLETLGIVEKSALSGRYLVGPRLLAIAAKVQARSRIWDAAEPVLRRLSERYNETVYLTARDGNSVVFQEKIECDRSIRYVIELGRVASLHAGAGGRAILAGMDPVEADQLVDVLQLDAVTDRTITDRDELRRRLKEDRERRFSFSMGERVVGGVAIAAPYFRADGQCRGSVVYTSPLERFETDRLGDIADDVIAAAGELSALLGAVGSGG